MAVNPRLLLGGILAAAAIVAWAWDKSHDDGSEEAEVVLEAPTGDFDYYVLALTWAPGFCSGPGAPKFAPECRQGLRLTVHGLWPQNERGYPEFCGVEGKGVVEHGLVKRASKFMPSENLLRHEWEKHGTCTGMTAEGYVNTTAALWQRIALPDRLAGLKSDKTFGRAQLERMMVEANPGHSPQSVTLKCRKEVLEEVQLCYTKELEPRDCASDVKETCPRRDILVEAPG